MKLGTAESGYRAAALTSQNHVTKYFRKAREHRVATVPVLQVA